MGVGSTTWVSASTASSRVDGRSENQHCAAAAMSVSNAIYVAPFMVCHHLTRFLSMEMEAQFYFPRPTLIVRIPVYVGGVEARPGLNGRYAHVMQVGRAGLSSPGFTFQPAGLHKHSTPGQVG